MKIYVAGKFDEKQQARGAMAQLRALGHEITYDWTQHPEEQSESNLQHAADCDLDGVLRADAVLMLLTDPLYAYRGSFTELGAALASKRPVYAVCPDANAYCRSNCFYYASGVVHCDSLQDALEQIGK
jgi:nucleoside 2-deoxyribosyltransferase